MLEYQLIRSKRRKTLLLQVKYGQVTVRAPYSVNSVFIDTFIQEKSSWLRAKVAQQQSEAKPCNFTQGAHLLYLGEIVRLNLSFAKKAKVFVSNASLSEKQLNIMISDRVKAKLISAEAQAKQVKKQLETYFKQQAEQLFYQRVRLLSEQTSLVVSKLTIRQYRARWGSCNNRGEVSLNYLLMMTPLFVIDYVIVHELCHLEYLNHSKNFWNLVEKHSPNYKVAKQWLSDHQLELQWRGSS